MSAPILGLASWKPNRKTQALIRQVRLVLEEYESYLPLTGRQIFYRLVGAHGYPKTEADYKNLLDKLNRARRSGMIDWSAIRDDGVTEIPSGQGFVDPDAFRASVRVAAERYRRPLTDGQTFVVEVWAEATGMTAQIARSLSDLGVIVFSSGGFNSTTMKHDAACRIIERYRDENQVTVLLHVGDHDPSGVSIFENLVSDLSAFIYDYTGPVVEQFALTTERVAVTVEQAEEMGLDSSPPKRTDSRTGSWVGDTFQAEAIPPDRLMAILRDSAEVWIDLEMLEQVKQMSAAEADDLVDWVDRETE